MKFFRPCEVSPIDIKIGDKINVDLGVLGIFPATIHRIEDDAEGAYLTLMFDDCIASHYMNEGGTNLGGYEVSDLCSWLKEVIFPKFPEELRDKMLSLTLPTYGMIFGHDTWGERSLDSDDDNQFLLMKKRSNRVADIYGEATSYWIRNASLAIFDTKSFGGVTEAGTPSQYPSTYYFGVRPVFIIKILRREMI